MSNIPTVRYPSATVSHQESSPGRSVCEVEVSMGFRATRTPRERERGTDIPTLADLVSERMMSIAHIPEETLWRVNMALCEFVSNAHDALAAQHSDGWVSAGRASFILRWSVNEATRRIVVSARDRGTGEASPDHVAKSLHPDRYHWWHGVGLENCRSLSKTLRLAPTVRWACAVAIFDF